jgi:hypothetical protein
MVVSKEHIYVQSSIVSSLVIRLEKHHIQPFALTFCMQGVLLSAFLFLPTLLLTLLNKSLLNLKKSDILFVKIL